MPFRLICLFSLVIFAANFTYAITKEECEFAQHATAAYDATDRSEFTLCSDPLIAKTLPVCAADFPSAQQRNPRSKKAIR